MKRLPALCVAAALALSASAYAHGGDVIYFEFAPDAWASQRHTASSAATPYQLFSPLTDFQLTGFDFWLDNTGSSGQATFTLADSQGTTLATQTATIPSLNQIPGGHLFHVDLASPLALMAQQTYSIQISSSLAGLGLYYADSITYLEHNRQFINPYTGGVARLGQIEQTFSFKFALYTPPPSTGGGTPPAPPPPPPAPIPIVISNARVVAVTHDSVTFAWTTNVASDSGVAVRMQLSPKFIFASNFDSTMELEHTITVAGLTPNVFYFIDAYSGYGDGSPVTTYTTSFQTPAGPPASPDPSPPPPSPDPSPTPNPPPPSPNPNPNPPPPSPNPNPTPNPSPTPNPGTPPAAPGPGPTPSPTPNPGSNPPPGSSPTPSPTPPSGGGGGGGGGPAINLGGGGGGGGVYWTPPSSEPGGGYRVDVFGADNTLRYQFTVPAGTHQQRLPSLPDGTYRTIVYANNDNVFTKVAAPITFSADQVESGGFSTNMLVLIGLLLATGGGYAGWKILEKKKASPVPPEQ